MNFKNNAKSIALWFIIALFLVAVFNVYQGTFKREQPLISLSDFIGAVQKGEVKKVIIKDREVQAVFDGEGEQVMTAYKPPFYDPIPFLLEQHVPFESAPLDTSPFTLLTLLQLLLPLVFLVLTWFFLFRQVNSGSGGGRTLGFGRARAKLADPDKNPVTFKDVEGIEEAKQDLKEIVEFLKDPQRFQGLGARIPKGVLLIGPPGTGKTLLAKAVAGEAGVPFFSISGSDFVEMFVGVGASRVRDLFNQAKQNAPCIVFIDEIDAVGRQRGPGLGGGHDEREQTLNQLLVEMDGFDPKEEVIVIAATNRVDVLDSALLRPGRFDRRVNVELPDLKGRESILGVHLKKIRVAKDVSIGRLARLTPGFSGADLENLANEAALRAARLNKKAADAEDFEASRDKLIMGPERRSLLMSENEKKLIACHEGGHAVVAYHCQHSDPIHKATIMPRGGALGMVVRFPEDDCVSVSKAKLIDDMAVALGGRIAEELVFGPQYITTGASSDFQFTMRIARKMVVEWGMSKPVGLMHYASSQDESFWKSNSLNEPSQELKKLIDKEIKKLIDEAYKQALTILTCHQDHLTLVTQALLEHETLTGEEIHMLLTKGNLEKPVITKPSAPKKPKTPRKSEVPVEESTPPLLTPQEEG